jgi:hypothetical protein
VDFAASVVRLEPGVTKNREDREFPFAAFTPFAAACFASAPAYLGPWR